MCTGHNLELGIMPQNVIFKQLQYVKTNESYFKDIIFLKPEIVFISLRCMF